MSLSKNKQDTFKRSASPKSKYENVEDADFKEIKPDDQDDKKEKQ